MTKINQSYDYDVAIVGGGSAGYAAARATASAGLRTVVIDGGEELGGLCILRGCMPTKALLYAAEVMHLASHPQPWGIQTEKVSFDFDAVMRRKDALIKEFADYRRDQLLSGRFKLLRANAAFEDAHTVRLSDGAKLTAAHFVITTGSSVAPPPLPQLRGAGYLTTDDALEIKSLPESLIILGGGPSALEFGQFFARFGVKVTIVQRSPHVLHDFDADAAAVIENVFRREGVTVFTNTTLLGSGRNGAQKMVLFESEGKSMSVSAAEILFALGRVPNTSTLGLDKIGVTMESGRIVADEFMQTSVPHIWTAGDCTGPHEIVHLAVQQGEIAAHNLVHPHARKKMDYRLFMSVVFTEPQIASVGLSEKDARAQGIPFLAASYPFNDHGKSLIMEARDGFVKLLAAPKTGEILGGACVGPHGGDLIHEITAAMYRRMTVQELAGMPHYHPTLAEIWTYPAEELAAQIALP